MSKPQVAAEPTMEEILASIRKMISDDKPGPSPMPDAMGRTPFGQSISRGSPAAETSGRAASELGAANRAGGASPSNFNSLSDALKVAAALSDQRRSLQQDIATALDKVPRNNLEALTELSAGRADPTRSLAEEHSAKAAGAGKAPSPSASEAASGLSLTGSASQDLLSFDFGTMVPERDGNQPKSPTGDAKRGIADPATELSAAKPEGKAEQQPGRSEASAESRVLPLRSGLSGSAINIAPFPRPMREATKSVEADPPAPATPILEESAPTREGVSAEASKAEMHPATKAEPVEGDALGKHGEALLDAVVDLVQQQPNALSVFASGASFISGVGGKKPAETLPAVAEVPSAPAVTAETSAPKMDRAAAELLRPMLRQWLAENMERILEEALRSEITNQTPGGKGPGNS